MKLPDHIDYTVTTSWRARWWKRPWLWLLRRPTRIERTYPQTKLVSWEMSPDGSSLTATFTSPEGVVIDFSGSVPS